MWGFEFSGGKLRIHNPYVKGRVSAHRLSDSAAYFEVDPDDELWGVYVAVDWGAAAPAFAAEAVVCAAADVLSPPSPEALASNPNLDRIAVATFDGTTLERDYVHGMHLPQLWVAV